MREQNPFVGPQPLGAKNPLFGRNRELRELRYLLTAERIVLLYSPSGAGKSSLLLAKGGLVEAMAQRFDVWKVTRVNTPPEGAVRNRFSHSLLAGLERGLPLERDTRMVDYVQRALAERGGDAKRNVLLVVDQFEEVLRLEPHDRRSKEAFFDELGELLTDEHIWALLVIREDFLAPLDEYAMRLPTHLRNRYRMDLFSVEGAREFLVGTVEHGGRTISEDAAAQLVTDLAAVTVQRADGTLGTDTGRTIEPMQIQVAAWRLWDQMPDDDARVDAADVQRFGKVSEALSGYYALRTRQIAGEDDATERAIREWVQQRLITADGVRAQVLMGENSSGALSNDLIEKLIKAHLVRTESRANAMWFELAHDRLVRPVRENNAEWFEAKLAPLQKRAKEWSKDRSESLLARGGELRAMEEWAAENAGVVNEDEQRYLKAARLGRRRQHWLYAAVAGLTVLLLLACGAALYAFQKEREAKQLTALAFERQVLLTRDSLDSLDPKESSRRLLVSILAARLRPTHENFAVALYALRMMPKRMAQVNLPEGTARKKPYLLEYDPQGKQLLALRLGERPLLINFATKSAESVGPVMGLERPAHFCGAEHVAVAHLDRVELVPIRGGGSSVVAMRHDVDVALGIANAVCSPQGDRMVVEVMNGPMKEFELLQREGTEWRKVAKHVGAPSLLTPTLSASGKFVLLPGEENRQALLRLDGKGAKKVLEYALADVGAAVFAHHEEGVLIGTRKGLHHFSTVANGGPPYLISDFPGGVEAVGWAPKGPYGVIVDSAGRGHFWESGEDTYPMAVAEQFALHPLEHKYAHADEEAYYEEAAEREKPLYEAKPIGDNNQPDGVSLLPGGRRALVWNKSTILDYDLAEKKLNRKVDLEKSRIAIDPTGAYVADVDQRGGVLRKVGDGTTRKFSVPQERLAGMRSVGAITPDGTHALLVHREFEGAGPHHLRILNLERNKQVGVIEVADAVTAITTFADGRFAIASRGVVKMYSNYAAPKLEWERNENSEVVFVMAGDSARKWLGTLTANRRVLNILSYAEKNLVAFVEMPESAISIAFGEQEATVFGASSDYNGAVKVYERPMNIEGIERMGCAAAGRNLTRGEWTKMFGDLPYRQICAGFGIEERAR